MSQAQNPLLRLAEFPFMMNWRGTWSVTEQYLQNDVAISPINGSSYVLADTSVLSGLDPSLSTAWIELAPAATGLNQINQGAGITVVNPAGPITTVSNAGVITIQQGANITVDNTDPQNPVIASTALSGVSAGAGIGVSGLSFSPTITNTGVRTIAVGAGLVSNNDPNNPAISATGVLSIAAGNGILVTPPPPSQVLTITNNGVRTVSGTVGLTVNNTDPNNPVLTNTGVLSVAAGSNVLITGTAINPIISANVPKVSFINTLITASGFPVAPAGLGQLPLSISGNTGIFVSYIANPGPPDPTGIFTINLASINLFLSAVSNVASGEKVSISLIDNVTTAPTPIVYPLGDCICYFPTPPTVNTYPFQIRPGVFAFNVTALRATGFRVPSAIGFLNSTGATLEINTWDTGLFPTYYPAGVF